MSSDFEKANDLNVLNYQMWRHICVGKVVYGGARYFKLPLSKMCSFVPVLQMRWTTHQQYTGSLEKRETNSSLMKTKKVSLKDQTLKKRQLTSRYRILSALTLGHHLIYGLQAFWKNVSKILFKENWNLLSHRNLFILLLVRCCRTFYQAETKPATN